MRQIVFFDGECGVCNTFVQFLLKHDRGRFTFAPLQGETARLYLGQGRAPDLSTVIYADGERIYLRSEAVLRIARAMGGLWAGLWIFYLVPRGIRDPLYALFARYRHLFLRGTVCAVPTPEERRRFLP
jgi:predicted DCC family thiol-disulfide oxidoreductase YuxK